jgi:rhodanese-related sulfurtransferase
MSDWTQGATMTRIAMAIVLLCGVWTTAVDAGTLGQASMSEAGFRAQAANLQKPVYPASLVPKKISGVAVAAIVVGTDGRPESVIVLEAPHELMAEAVRTAVQKSTFQPISVRQGTTSTPTAVASKLTFYFRVTGGAGEVLNPDEMPGGRRASEAGGVPAARADGSGPAVNSAGGGAETIDLNQLNRLIAAGKAVVLDIRERDAYRRSHREGALNIPMNELSLRAPIELRGAAQVVLDCSQGQESRCRVAAHFLEAEKFRVLMFVP